MNILIIKAFMRNRHVKTMFFLITLFTSIIVPFYAITTHFQFIEGIASKYLPHSNSYLAIESNYRFENLSKDMYVYVEAGQAKISLEYTDIHVPFYSFSNITTANNILDMHAHDVNGDSCIVSRYIMEKYGLKLDDEITVYISGRQSKYRVIGTDKLFPLIIPYDPSIKPIFTLIKISGNQGFKNIYEDVDGYKVYKLSGYLGLVSELRNEAEKVLDIWMTPIYIIISFSILIISIRFIYSVEDDVKLLHDLGISRKILTPYITVSIIPIIISSIILGISLGIVFSQILAKLLYAVFNGVNIYPMLTPLQYIHIFLYILISSSIGLLLAFILGGSSYAEAD